VFCREKHFTFPFLPVIRLRFGDLLQVLAFLLLVVAAGWGLAKGAENLGYSWYWNRIPRYLVVQDAAGWHFGPLLQGLGITLTITGLGLLLSFAIGLITALLRLSSSPLGRMLAKGYLETIRNTPLLIQIFILYFVIALSLFEGAYASEIIRAGILAIPVGQWEASASLGMNRAQGYRFIVLPQALRNMLPPLTSQAISLVKDSALVSTIAIYDLTMQGQRLIAETFLTFEIWMTVAAIYLAVTLLLSLLVRMMESWLVT
jgi:polar amino acid transport system permease protein